jgi:hypothetical protein
MPAKIRAGIGVCDMPLQGNTPACSGRGVSHTSSDMFLGIKFNLQLIRTFVPRYLEYKKDE